MTMNFSSFTNIKKKFPEEKNPVDQLSLFSCVYLCLMFF